jgi:FAD/FMN-containing dehydrogenase
MDKTALAATAKKWISADWSRTLNRVEEFTQALGDVPFSLDPREIRVKSKDRFSLSPMLSKTLAGKIAEVVVTPRDKAELKTLARAAFAYDMPLTPRGTGTANYGQSVPLKGGAMVEMTGLSGITWVRDGAIRAKAGTLVHEVEAAALATGQELRFFPTTLREATLGGFIAGGTGGVGSINYGVLRDNGNILGIEVMSVEAEPQLVELRGDETRLVQHGYGTNGLITEIELPLVPARDWTEVLVTFGDYTSAYTHAIAIAREDGIQKKLASAYEWPVGQWLRPLAPFVPEGQSLVIAMIETTSMARYEDMVAGAGGTIQQRSPNGKGPYGRPLHEFAFGHTTQQVQRSMPKITEVEGFFRAEDLEGLVGRVYEKIRHTGPLRLEVRRWDGDIVCSGSSYIDFTEESQVEEVVQILRGEGLPVANPHASNVRGVGKKEIGPAEVTFKKRMDPKGLLNPGRFEIEAERDAKIDLHLTTDGWLKQDA